MRASLFLFIFLMSFSSRSEIKTEFPDPDPNRFIEEIKNFETWDSKNSFAINSFLFVGSSSIKYWKSAQAFPGKQIINRGFGGSDISDVNYFYHKIVKPYSAKKIFLYAGDNDIARGKTVDQVFKDYKEFVMRVQLDFPETKIVFIAIKPSKKRWDKWPRMKIVNNMVRDYSQSHNRLEYADLSAPLINSDGNLKDVFIEDGLHLNQFGYSLWQKFLDSYLK
jgi:lysophospholipase L1-like esterase